MALNVAFPFTTQTTVTIAGATHGLGTNALCVAVYDASTPAVLIEPASVSVHPSNFEVEVKFAQSQSGTVVLNAGRPTLGMTGNVAVAFAGVGSVSIPGTIHTLGTAALLVAVYDASTPRVRIDPARVTVHPSSFDVDVTFGQNQSGIVVLCGASGTSLPLPITRPRLAARARSRWPMGRMGWGPTARPSSCMMRVPRHSASLPPV